MLLQKSECLSATLRLVVSIARKTHWHHARLDPLDIVQGEPRAQQGDTKVRRTCGFRSFLPTQPGGSVAFHHPARRRHRAHNPLASACPRSDKAHDGCATSTWKSTSRAHQHFRSWRLFSDGSPGEVQALQDWSLTTASLDALLGLSSSATIGSMVPDEASEDLQNQNIDRWLMKSMIDEASQA